eukprot:12142194-Prorocentrum_lima.AAC.1
MRLRRTLVVSLRYAFPPRPPSSSKVLPHRTYPAVGCRGAAAFCSDPLGMPCGGSRQGARSYLPTA